MAEYGLTSNGVNIKRLDVILEEMHTELTEQWGVNTKQTSGSLVNVLLTNVADAIAELWELGQDVYNSQYPSTAEGVYLDNVGQFAGVTRESAAPSYYYILCTGTDGTTIPTDTIISSDTSPVINLRPLKSNTISRDNFNNATVKIISLDGNPLTIAIGESVYSVTVENDVDETIALQELADSVDNDDYVVTVGDSDGLLHIASVNETSSGTLVLSDNLTTTEVGSVFTFATEEYGDIYLPAGSITVITKAVTGLESITNVGTYIAGQQIETDVEYRQSYLAKIFNRSTGMLNSIRSAILNNCQGVTTVIVYENDTDETDADGRYPHSIEVVCDGGADAEIAQQILNTKPCGINTYGETEITLYGTYNEEIVIRFNRPNYVNLWFNVELTVAKNATLPSNYDTLIRTAIISAMGSIGCGDDIIPQEVFLPTIYSNVYGIGYVEITMETGDSKPSEYEQHVVYATVRDRFITSEDMIEVSFSG